MKKILCFGDSNTHGFNPIDGSRYPKSIRWSGVLAKNLEGKFQITEAGLNNRNCFVNNPAGSAFVGHIAIQPYLRQNFDLVIFALGINDLQFLYNISLKDFKIGLKYTLHTLKNAKKLVLCPPVLSKDVLYGNFAHQFDIASIEKSKKLPEIYKEVCRQTNSEFVDLNDIVKVSKIDGLHLDPISHRTLGLFLADKVLEIFQ